MENAFKADSIQKIYPYTSMPDRNTTRVHLRQQNTLLFPESAKINPERKGTHIDFYIIDLTGAIAVLQVLSA